MNFTPGPWKVRTLNCEDHRGMGWVEGANGTDIACCGAMDVWEHENKANAHLIAAAPDLLEALRQTVDSLDYWFRRYGDPHGCESQMMQNARAAISKAEGGNNG